MHQMPIKEMEDRLSCSDGKEIVPKIPEQTPIRSPTESFEHD